MTENEAISYFRMATDEAGNEKFSDLYKEMCSMAIQALEEIQQYRAIGLTPKMVKEMIESEKLASHAAIIRGAELELYQEIGTVEECRIAVERMKPKKVKDKICDCGDYFGICPVCDRGVVNQFGTPYKYCPKCGTKMDWE